MNCLFVLCLSAHVVMSCYRCCVASLCCLLCVFFFLRNCTPSGLCPLACTLGKKGYYDEKFYLYISFIFLFLFLHVTHVICGCWYWYSCRRLSIHFCNSFFHCFVLITFCLQVFNIHCFIVLSFFLFKCSVAVCSYCALCSFCTLRTPMQ